MIRWMPGLAALRDYKLSYLPHDLGAGLTLGAVMVPVGLAYGELAGLPMAGLYGSMLPLLAYALFGSSRQLVVGPDTAMAAIVAVAVAPLAVGDPGRLDVDGLSVNTGVLSDRLVRAARRRGKSLYAWTVDDPRAMVRLIERGVGGMVTNAPDILVRIRREREELSDVEDRSEILPLALR